MQGQVHVLELPIVISCRIISGSLLVISGAMKVGKTTALRGIIREFHLLPQALEKPAALTLPFLELIIGCITVLSLGVPGDRAAWACNTAGALFVLFAIAVGINLGKGRYEISCGCFGSNTTKLSWGLTLRNFSLAAAAFYGASGGRKAALSQLQRLDWSVVIICLLCFCGGLAGIEVKKLSKFDLGVARTK